MAHDDSTGTLNRLVWLDLEMTGLVINSTDPDVPDDEIVEIGVLVTDADLNPLDEGLSIVIKPTDASLDRMNSFVRGLHTASGLLPLIPDGVTLAEAEKAVLDYFAKHLPGPKQVPLGGNTVHQDRKFLAKYMPGIDNYLHYRIIDVSSIKELARRWFPDAAKYMPPKTGNHRALADAMESAKELAYYRLLLFTTNAPTKQAATAVGDAVAAQWEPYLP